MSLATKLVTFCFLVLAVNAARGQSSPSAIRGTLSERGKPITNATIFLQSFDDEMCAKLFTTGREDRKSASKLESCMHDVSTTSADAAGRYEFADPRAGWYAIHFLWNIGKKPNQTMFSQGWTVMYGGHKDSTGKYDTMAQDIPSYFSAKEDATRNFDVPVAQLPKPLRGRLSLAAKDWGITLDLPGFTVKTVETKPDSRRYVVPEFRGQPIKQETLFACRFYDNTYIDLHVSKVNYSEADEPLFADVLN